ncbi:hypothetical protein TRIATDRAFT_89989 [Trichoderma atroviride IMI 206040]|uniref:Uncharacterized protein n=1 Tax=Hypocrea atroviridis (strain ATCC 20476 / IMI 206040) TaxID=452589 RepID=G9NRJ6_HYPAI|nr:uncharacterized protein TRIATDRAFT_89989 [Trichoderma atroviride IMI 206040]EHK46629.1 hypothetical protein TRIATDRAFT_89989 [Trichoderma atroviride IMI 206040]
MWMATPTPNFGKPGTVRPDAPELRGRLPASGIKIHAEIQETKNIFIGWVGCTRNLFELVSPAHITRRLYIRNAELDGELESIYSALFRMMQAAPSKEKTNLDVLMSWWDALHR